MRALCLVHYPVFGGPHNQILRLAKPLQASGWESLAVVPNEPGNAAERLRSNGIDVVQLPLHRLRQTLDVRIHGGLLASFVPEVWAIRRLIRQRQIDVVVVGGLANPHAAIAARLEGVPVIWQILDSRTPQLLQKVMMPVVGTLADAVMFAGGALRDIHRASSYLAVPSVVFYPPVDTQRFGPDPDRRRATRSNWGIPEQAPVVGMVANLNPQKGVEFFIRAAGQIYARHPETYFLIVGARDPNHDDYARLIQQEVERSGIPGDHVIFSGGQSCVEDFYPAMDVMAITSVPASEGAPTTVIEAMACGLPVVGTDVGAVRELVQQDVTGILVPPLVPAAIAQACLRLIEDPTLVRRFGAAGRERVLERFSIDTCVQAHLAAFEAAMAHAHLRDTDSLDAPSPPPTPQPDLRSLLVCPMCREALDWSADAATCTGCGHGFSVVDGIPVLLPNEVDANSDELHHHSSSQKHQQATYFSHHEAEEFEIRRPHGSAPLHRWLLKQKLLRSVGPVSGTLAGATALCVCAGSGMDAEFLDRAGARVLACDISLGAARRMVARARRYGLNLMPIVADVECLPLADGSVDLAYVHDGLHHLEQPDAGLLEMLRVSRRAVSVTEPAAAWLTKMAVRLGLAQEREDAGNVVARLKPEQVGAQLERAGFRVLEARRYAMYYRHQPGWVSCLLSLPLVFQLVRIGWVAGDAIFGRFGNKMAVVAFRESPPAAP